MHNLCLTRQCNSAAFLRNNSSDFGEELEEIPEYLEQKETFLYLNKNCTYSSCSRSLTHYRSPSWTYGAKSYTLKKEALRKDHEKFL